MKEGMSIQSAERQHRLQEWSRKVADCRQSGKSVKRWCEENGITLKTYYRWQQKVFSAMIEQQQQLARPSPCEPQFAELSIADIESKRTGVPSGLAASIRIGNATVDFYSGADPDMVKILCQVLKQC